MRALPLAILGPYPSVTLRLLLDRREPGRKVKTKIDAAYEAIGFYNH